jgi:predicted permease
MASLRRFFLRLVNAFRPSRADADMTREIAAHLALLEDDFRHRGLSPQQARSAARRAFGGVEQTKELQRDVRSFRWIDDARGDIRYGARALRRSPGFTAVAVLILAIGIGANTAIFSVLYTFMVRSLPVARPEQLVELLYKYPGDPRLNIFSWHDYERIRGQNHVFSDVIAQSSRSARFQISAPSAAPELVDGVLVSGNFFDALGLRPVAGRLIGAADSEIGSSAAAVVVISWRFWQSHYGLDPAVLGTPLIVNGVPTTIIGVAPREFSGLQLGVDPPLWLPLALEPLLESPSRLPDGAVISLVGRLKPGVSISQAQAEMRVLDQPRLAALEAHSHDVQWRQVKIDVEPAGAGLSLLRDRFGPSLLLTMWAVGVLLLLACVNVASLLLARAAARRHEMATRVALGAGRSRIVRQMLTESLLLSTIGAACGVAVAYAGAAALVKIIASGRSPVGMPQPLQIAVALDLPVLLFAVAATVAAGVLFGVAPAGYALVSMPSSPLRESGRASEPRTWKRLGHALVISQVALSVVLLSAAVLFIRHLTELRTVGIGFNADSVLQVSLDWSRTPDASARRALLYQQLLDRMTAIPGVRSATLAAMTPISGSGGSLFVHVEGFPEGPDDRRRVNLNDVAPRYFETLGTPLTAGRDFTPADAHGSRLAIVNEAMARYYFGTGSPIGRQLTFENRNQPIEIIGVVGDAKYNDLHDAPPRTIYLDAFQGRGATNPIFVLRTDVPPMSVVADVRRAAGEVLPAVPVANVTTLADQVSASILPERLIAMLSELFGVLAAVLAAIGLYGLLSYTVSRRTNEIGLRMALGARRGDVIRMVLTRAFGLVIGGLATGIPLALWTKAYASSVLAIIAATAAPHPVVIAAGATLPILIATFAMLVVALAAALLPVRRATAIDPVVALRCE